MHNPKSTKLPIIGRNHSFRITELSDIDHHKKLAEKHYHEVKRKQTIVDYNLAVENLSDLYDVLMNAQETESDLKHQLKETQDSLSQVQGEIQKLKNQAELCHNRLTLCKARMQHCGISLKDLDKIRPVSQGTQSITEAVKNPEEVDKEPLNIVQIPEDETDRAVKNMLIAENITIEDQTNPPI